jgi:hypothetical protein
MTDTKQPAPNYQADRIAKLDAQIAALEAAPGLHSHEKDMLRELKARRDALR